jgi:hypothetical protein
MPSSHSIDQKVVSPLNLVVGLIVLALGGFGVALAVRLLFFI